MGVTLLVLGIMAIVAVATVKEYLKQKDYEKAREEAAALKAADTFKEEERLVEVQTPTVILEPVAEAPKTEKPKRKYYHKKKASKPKKTSK